MPALATDCHSGPMRVFVSHSGSGKEWATWAARHLRGAGHEVHVDDDWAAHNFLAKMRQALRECELMVALYAADYFAEGSYSLMELDAVSYTHLTLPTILLV